MPARAVTLVLVVVAAVVAAGGGREILGGAIPGVPGEPSRAGGGHATVTRIVDGDTIVLSGLGRSRLIGVDTPEVHGRRECFGAHASAFAERMLAGQRVRYEIGAEPRDRFDRLLVYVWLADGRPVNELLVAGGYARPLAITPNVRFAERLRRLGDDARAGGRGLWSRGACGGHTRG